MKIFRTLNFKGGHCVSGPPEYLNFWWGLSNIKVIFEETSFESINRKTLWGTVLLSPTYVPAVLWIHTWEKESFELDDYLEIIMFIYVIQTI